jgi:hypothetical protein
VAPALEYPRLFIARILDLAEQVSFGHDPEHSLKRVNDGNGAESMRDKQIHDTAIRRIG